MHQMMGVLQPLQHTHHLVHLVLGKQDQERLTCSCLQTVQMFCNWRRHPAVVSHQWAAAAVQEHKPRRSALPVVTPACNLHLWLPA
jgi:hypothetical protein